MFVICLRAQLVHVEKEYKAKVEQDAETISNTVANVQQQIEAKRKAEVEAERLTKELELAK